MRGARQRRAGRLEPGEIVLSTRLRDGGWYDYEAKYTPGGMELVVPARIPAALRRARPRARGRGVRRARLRRPRARRLLRRRRRGAVLVNELNTMPGFTETSVYGKLLAASGVPYEELLDRLVELAIERHARERAYQF